MELRLDKIKKSFGEKTVLDNVSLSAVSGSAFGLLGRNGSGKTTTARIILNILLPDSGYVLLDGKPVGRERNIGYLPEERGLYPKLPILSQLVYFGELRGLTKADAAKRAKAWLERVELSDCADRKLATLSKGNQQKVQLASTLLAEPDIIILDEPFSGLDPINAKLLKTIVEEQVEKGKLVFFSSHQMDIVENLCDDIAILHDGTIVLSGALSKIQDQYPKTRLTVRLREGGATAPPARTAKLVLHALGERVASVSETAEGASIELHDEASRHAVLETLVGEKLDISEFSIDVPSLEEIFVEYTGGTRNE